MSRNVTPARSFKELTSRLNDLAKSLSSADKRQADKSIYTVLVDAANSIKAQVKSNASAQGVPQSVINSVFTWADPSSDKPGKNRALVGVGKRRTMKSWTAGQHPKSPRAKVSPGGKVAESLAAMYELGTSRMQARPYFTPAIEQKKKEIVDKIKSGINDIISSYAKT